MKNLKIAAAMLTAVIALTTLNACTNTTDDMSEPKSNEISLVDSKTSDESEISDDSEISDEESKALNVDSPEPAALFGEGQPAVRSVKLTSLGEVIKESPSKDIEICSVKQALSRFEEIASKPARGTPENIVKTLMERNVLCFAIMYGKCWEQDGEGYGTQYNNSTPRYIPIKSDYINSPEQIRELFDDTYTAEESSHLLNPYDVDDFCDTFFFESGNLYYDLDQMRAFHEESFETTTYAAIVSATADKITFGRVGTPNNFLFTAVNEDGKWVLETLVVNAPAYSQMYTELTKTKRSGNSEFMEWVETQVGNVGGMKYCSWYGFSGRIEWCAAFVTWAYSEWGVDGPVFTRCDSEGRRWFREQKRWKDSSYRDIAPGDSIFFDWNLDDSADHVGLVVGRDDKYVYTVEGNRSDTCIACKYTLDNEHILGYGLMWD